MDISKIATLLIQQEGKQSTVYLDIKNIPTIGVGFNLTRHDAEKLLGIAGYLYDDILAGEELDYTTIEDLLHADILTAIVTCKRCIDYFEFLNENIQTALVCMAFNLGEPRFKGFKKMIEAINNQNFALAVVEMLDSRWHKELPGRSMEIARIFAQEAYQV